MCGSFLCLPWDVLPGPVEVEVFSVRCGSSSLVAQRGELL